MVFKGVFSPKIRKSEAIGVEAQGPGQHPSCHHMLTVQ